MTIVPLIIFMVSCADQNIEQEENEPKTKEIPKPQYTLTDDQTHNKFSRSIPPLLVQRGYRL